MSDLVCFGYTRVSTRKQATLGVSLELQKKKLLAYAELHDLPDMTLVSDEGISAKNIKGRPGASDMIERALKRGGIIVVYKLDRLFRNTEEALATVRRFRKAGCALHSVSELIDTSTPQGLFVFTVQMAAAELERGLTGQRTRDGLQYKKENGEVHNHVPYGFDSVGPKGERKLVRNSVEMAVVQLITAMKPGSSFSRIADHLNVTGVLSKKGGNWHAASVSGVLKYHESLSA